MINSATLRHRQWFPLLLLFLFASCAPTTIARPPVTAGLVAAAAARWARLSELSNSHETLQTIADLDLQTTGPRYHFKAALLLKRPALMRIESIPLIGPPNFLLSLTKESLKVFLPGEKFFYLGQPVRENLAFFLPIGGLAPADIVAILRGLPPPLADQQFDIREISTESSSGLEIFSKGLKVQTLWFTKDGEHLSFMEIHPPGGGVINVNYGAYRKTGNNWLPEKVTLADPDKKARITVRYHDISWNENGEEASFDLPIPAGVSPLPLEQANGIPGNQ
ncbi:MAG: hypothetical protein WA133_06420 [Syntrophales bacterium]